MGGPTQLPLPSATGSLIPAAAYVRMSTEHQQYSTENQLDRIKEYAARRGRGGEWRSCASSKTPAKAA